jgi:hypothetical protein
MKLEGRNSVYFLQMYFRTWFYTSLSLMGRGSFEHLLTAEAAVLCHRFALIFLYMFISNGVILKTKLLNQHYHPVNSLYVSHSLKTNLPICELLSLYVVREYTKKWCYAKK